MAKKVKEKTAVSALSGRRIMTKEFNNYRFDMPSPAVLWDEDNNGYTIISAGPANARFAAAESYLDLSGYSREYLTTFPERITIQEGGTFRLKEDNTSVRKGMVAIELITEERLTPFLLATMMNNVADFDSPASFPLGPLEYSQVIFGRYRLLGQNNTIWTPENGIMQRFDEHFFGSGTPTTADKLWCYRIVYPLGTLLSDTDDYVVIPPSRFVISATIRQEDDKAFMMRQKNSYELATND
jgi:hypothetical protein